MPRNETRRYAAVNDQVKDLLDAMVTDCNPGAFAVNIGRAMLAAEMYTLNEHSHMAYEARVGIIRAIEQRIDTESEEHR